MAGGGSCVAPVRAGGPRGADLAGLRRWRRCRVRRWVPQRPRSPAWTPPRTTAYVTGSGPSPTAGARAVREDLAGPAGAHRGRASSLRGLSKVQAARRALGRAKGPWDLRPHPPRRPVDPRARGRPDPPSRTRRDAGSIRSDPQWRSSTVEGPWESALRRDGSGRLLAIARGRCHDASRLPTDEARPTPSPARSGPRVPSFGRTSTPRCCTRCSSPPGASRRRRQLSPRRSGRRPGCRGDDGVALLLAPVDCDVLALAAVGSGCPASPRPSAPSRAADSLSAPSRPDDETRAPACR